MTAESICTMRCESSLTDDHTSDEDVPDWKAAQSFSGRNIDSGKLTSLLRIKFGVGTYNIHVSRKWKGHGKVRGVR